MAIFHLSVKTISRSAGRTATAAAAYRAGVEITDERTGD
ncbi:MAG: conjugal transfer protein TraA, partial [Cytophagaceae bacterium]